MASLDPSSDKYKKYDRFLNIFRDQQTKTDTELAALTTGYENLKTEKKNREEQLKQKRAQDAKQREYEQQKKKADQQNQILKNLDT